MLCKEQNKHGNYLSVRIHSLKSFHLEVYDEVLRNTRSQNKNHYVQLMLPFTFRKRWKVYNITERSYNNEVTKLKALSKQAICTFGKNECKHKRC